MKLMSVLVSIFAFGIVFGVAIQNAPYYLSTQAPLKLSQLTGEFDYQPPQAVFHGYLVTPLDFLAEVPTLAAPVLGVSTNNKRIEVDLTNQRLYAFEGDTKVMDFAVSTGKWGRTPTGTFQIWTKLRYTKMSGGSKTLRTYYYLPNVPYTMYFYNDQIPKAKGYGLHGAYWHNNFGHPMSHGCVNMKIDEAGQIYNWSDPAVPSGKNMVNTTADNPSTPIVIYGTAPST